MKVQVTPDDGPVETLADLSALVERASALVQTGGPGDAAKTTVKVRTTVVGRLRAIEVSW
jgi:hypothetical protein